LGTLRTRSEALPWYPQSSGEAPGPRSGASRGLQRFWCAPTLIRQRKQRPGGTLAAMAVLRHALAADAGPTPHAAIMAVPVPAAMDRRERPLVDALKARQGRLRWSRLAARRRGEGEACCDRESAKPGQHFLHRCPPLSFILKARSLGRSCRRSNQHRGGRKAFAATALPQEQRSAQTGRAHAA
jgi:hypothetical protein